jgi:hypothetical protein
VADEFALTQCVGRKEMIAICLRIVLSKKSIRHYQLHAMSNANIEIDCMSESINLNISNRTLYSLRWYRSFVRIQNNYSDELFL